MNKNKGISLIVLIVTIIVIIILATVVILTISKNNPIESAKEARFKEDVRTFQDELAMSVSKEYTAKAGQRDNKFTATKFLKIQRYIPSFNKNYEGKFVIKQDELVYKTENLTEKELEMVQNLKVKENIKTSAEIIEDNAATSYGASVTNYSSNGVDDWKIFYSDGCNVYLISSEYLDLDKLPSKNGKKPTGTKITEYPKGASFNNIVYEYNGSTDITDERIKELNYDYFINNNYSNNYKTMKGVAYMLDIDIWKIYAEGKKAEYAIGGPTIEMLFDSYNKKYNVKYLAKATSNIGYKIKKSVEDEWKNICNYMLKMSDRLYVLPRESEELESGNKSGAGCMWVASPADHFLHAAVMDVSYIGGVRLDDDSHSGFRPVVCLKSDAVLTKISDTEYRID